MKADKAENREMGLEAIYKVMRPGEPPTKETAEALFDGLFFDADRYDLSAVGRVKLNMRLGLDAEDTVTTLRVEDLLAVVKELVNLKDRKSVGEGKSVSVRVKPGGRRIIKKKKQ